MGKQMIHFSPASLNFVRCQFWARAGRRELEWVGLPVTPIIGGCIRQGGNIQSETGEGGRGLTGRQYRLIGLMQNALVLPTGRTCELSSLGKTKIGSAQLDRPPNKTTWNALTLLSHVHLAPCNYWKTIKVWINCKFLQT